MKNSPSIPMYALAGIHSFLRNPLAAVAFGCVVENMVPSIPCVGTFITAMGMASIVPSMLSVISHSFHNGTATKDIFNASKTYVRNLCTSALADLPFAIAASYILPASVGFSVASYMAYTVFGKLSMKKENNRFNINEILYNCVAQPIQYFTLGKLGLLSGLRYTYNSHEVTNSDAVIESNKENSIQITEKDLFVSFNNIKQKLAEIGYHNHSKAIKFYLSESPIMSAFAENPMGKEPIISISKGLIAKFIAANHTKEEVINQLTAIIAHEYGHITLNHCSEVHNIAKNTFNLILPSSNLGSTIYNFNAQRCEYQADNIAVKVMGESESLSKGLSVICGYTPLNNEGMLAKLFRVYFVFSDSVGRLISTAIHPNTSNRIFVANKFIADMPQQEPAAAILARG